MANVLIADDSREFSTILKEYVEKEGYSVFIAGDGRKALEIFSANELDMVFLDVNMPVMNGYDVCREIRKKSNVPVIMITSHGDDYEKIMDANRQYEIGIDFNTQIYFKEWKEEPYKADIPNEEFENITNAIYDYLKKKEEN